MKKIVLSMLAITFAAASVMANGTVPVKKAKAKHAACTTKCTKQLCDKQASCPKTGACPGMPSCPSK